MNNAGILPSPKAIAGYKLASLPFEFKRRTRFRAGDQNEGGPQLYGWLGRDHEEESPPQLANTEQFSRSKLGVSSQAG